MKPILAQANLSFANLEGPFANKTIKRTPFFQFVQDPRELDYLRAAGFNLFSLANNHTADGGPQVLKESMGHLAAQNKSQTKIYYSGAATSQACARLPAIVHLQEKKLTAALLAYSEFYGQGVNPMNDASARRDIKALKNGAWRKWKAWKNCDLPWGPESAPKDKDIDIIIVSIHDDKEFSHVPLNRRVKSYRTLLKAGADVILGHHPHVGQGMERTQHGVIFYSLGDYSFGPTRKRYQKKGAKMYNMLAHVEFVRSNSKTVQEGGWRLHTACALPLYTDFYDSIKVGEQKFQPERFTPQVTPQPFAGILFDSFRRWSAQIKGNRTTFQEGKWQGHAQLCAQLQL